MAGKQTVHQVFLMVARFNVHGLSHLLSKITAVWLRLQVRHDLEVAEQELGKRINREAKFSNSRMLVPNDKEKFFQLRRCISTQHADPASSSCKCLRFSGYLRVPPR